MDKHSDKSKLDPSERKKSSCARGEWIIPGGTGPTMKSMPRR